MSKIAVFGLDSIITFGEHSGKTLRELYEGGNRRYLGWCLREKLFDVNSDIVRANCLAAYSNRTREIIANRQNNKYK